MKDKIAAVLGVVLVWALAGPGAALAQAPQVTIPSLGPLLRGYAAPDVSPPWLRPGILATYVGQIDSAPAVWQYWVSSTASGQAVVVKYGFTVNLGTRNIEPVASTASPLANGPFWIAPAALARLPGSGVSGVPGGQTDVSRATVTFGGRRVAAVVVQKLSSEARTLETYDLATGILLELTAVVTGTADEAVLHLAGIERLPYPFDQDATLPGWVRPGLLLRYQIAKRTVLNGYAGPPDYGQGYLAVERTGKRWAEVRVGSLVSYNFGQPIPVTSGSTNVVGGGNAVDWMPPGILAAIRRPVVAFASRQLGLEIAFVPQRGYVSQIISFGSSRMTYVYNAQSGVAVQYVQSGLLTANGGASQVTTWNLTGSSRQ